MSFSLNIKDKDRHSLSKNERTAEVLALIKLNLHDSLRRQERDSGISRDIFWRILRENKFYPYKMSLNQALNYNDFRQRFILQLNKTATV